MANIADVEVSVQEAKTQLSRLLRRVEAGESVVIRRGSEPVAMLVRAPADPSRRRIWGNVEGSLGPEFDELPDGFEPFA